MPIISLSTDKPIAAQENSISFLILRRVKAPTVFYLENIGETSVIGVKLADNERTYEPTVRTIIRKETYLEINIFDTIKKHKIYRLLFSNVMNQWYGLDVKFYRKNSKVFLSVLRERIYFLKKEARTEIIEV